MGEKKTTKQKEKHITLESNEIYNETTTKTNHFQAKGSIFILGVSFEKLFVDTHTQTRICNHPLSKKSVKMLFRYVYLKPFFCKLYGTVCIRDILKDIFESEIFVYSHFTMKNKINKERQLHLSAISLNMSKLTLNE